MNKIRLASLCILILLPILSNGQKITLNWGGPVKTPKKTMVGDIIGKYNNKVYVHRYKRNRKGNFIEIYDNQMNLLSSSEIVTSNTNDKITNFEKLMLVDGQLILFYSFYNRKLDKKFAFGNKVDEQGHVQGEPFEVDEIEAERKRNSGNFSFILSTDSSKILLYRNDPYEKHADESFNMKVLDKNLKTLWTKHVKLDVEDKDFSISDYTLANDGKVYMLGKFQHGNRTRKNGLPTYKYYIYSYSSEAKDPTVYEIGLDGKFISEIGFKVDRHDNLLCGGFFSKEDAMGIAGSFFLIIDGKLNKVLKKGIKEYDAEFLKNFLSDRRAEKGKELRYFEIKDFIFDDAGNATMIAEQDWVQAVTTCTQNGGCVTTYYYHSNSIILTRINKDGNITASYVIPKISVSANAPSNFQYFAAAKYGNKTFFIYNDNPKNLDITDPRKIKPLRITKAVAMLAVLDENGKLTKQPIFSSKESKTYLAPKLNLQVLDNQVVVYAEMKKKMYKFGIVTFE
jgi:hypothetical protein